MIAKCHKPIQGSSCHNLSHNRTVNRTAIFLINIDFERNTATFHGGLRQSQNCTSIFQNMIVNQQTEIVTSHKDMNKCQNRIGKFQRTIFRIQNIIDTFQIKVSEFDTSQKKIARFQERIDTFQKEFSNSRRELIRSRSFFPKIDTLQKRIPELIRSG